MSEVETGAGGRELERARRAMAKLENQVADQAGDLEDLRAVVNGLTGEISRLLATPPAGGGDAASTPGGDGEPPALVSWLEIDDPVLAQSAMADLVTWLERVYLAFGDAKLPPCWMWHPDAVAELLALRVAHWEAYRGKKASGAAAADWHERRRPKTNEGIKQRHGGCVLSKHANGRAGKTREVPMKGSGQRVAGHWAVERGMPTPTGEEMKEADAGIGR